MKLGEFFIQLGIKGDTKKLDDTIKKMDKAQDKQTKSLKEQRQQWAAITKSVAGFVTGITTAVVVLDRLGNSLLKTNQLYTNFSRQTGISIGNLNKYAGLARLSGMNLGVEQVANDLNNLQQKIFRLGLTGEGSGIFAQLGINPIGMNADRFLDVLRQRLKGLSGVQKSYALDELGLSREWLNVLELSDDEYASIIEKSKKLQLNEKERKALAKYTLIQQQNNMRWELAKQKLIIAFIPMITKIMEGASKIAVSISSAFNEKTAAVVRDIAAWLGIASLRAGVIQKALSFLLGGSLLKGLGSGLTGLLGLGTKKTATKAAAGLGLKTVGKGLLGAVSGPVGLALLAWTLFDIYGLLKDWFAKDTELDDNEPPIDTNNILRNISANSNMVNNFYNNPVPQSVVTDEIVSFMNKYLAEANK